MSGGSGSAGRVRGLQDVVCGLMFIGIGAMGLYFGRDFPMGTWVRPGTGVFPAMMCWGMIGSGAIIFIKGLIVRGEAIGHVAWRPVILISCAATAFALLIDPFGLVAATVAMCVFAGFAGHEIYPKEFILWTIIITFVGVAMFIWGLGMPIKTFPWD